MQENGVPVTYAYISDAHDNHTLATRFGPGRGRLPAAARRLRRGVRDVLQAARERRDHKTNTLFVVTVDEGDHFAGGPGTPAGDGSLAYAHTPCTPTSHVPVEPDRRGQREPEGDHPGGQPGVQRARRRCADDLRERPAGPGPIPRFASSSGTSERHRADPYQGGVACRSPSDSPTRSRRRRSTWSTPTRSGRRRSRCSATPTSSSRPQPSLRPPRPRRASIRSSPGTTATTRTRSPTPGSAWSGRACEQRRRRQDVDRPRRRPADDHRAPRSRRLLRRRRSRDHAGLANARPRRSRRLDKQITRRATRRRLQADQRAVRRVRRRHAHRVDDGDPADRRARSTTRSRRRSPT